MLAQVMAGVSHGAPGPLITHYTQLRTQIGILYSRFCCVRFLLEPILELEDFFRLTYIMVSAIGLDRN
jgi:ferric iron reductase protein FhuF